jgi:A nuclease of the HNH/ENDO VII superfamily with conserved WHH
VQDRAHTPDPAAAPDLGPPVPADPGHAQALLQHLQAISQLTPDGVAAALRQHPQLRDAVLHEVAARWGISGVQALASAEARQHGAPAGQPAPVAAGPATLAAPAHEAPAHQVAERDALNAVITVVARGPDGAVVARWRARGHWDGPLPVRYHGRHAGAAWSWSDPAARDTRIHTRADGTGGELVEWWATAHGAATVDVVASAVEAASGSDDVAPEVHAEPASPGPAHDTAKDTNDPLDGLDAEHQRIVAEFERSIGIDPDEEAEDDADDRPGARGGDPHGRTGPDTAVGGTGPGGPQARAGGDHEGSETRGAVEGRRLGSALGVEGGSEGGRFGGEGKPGDNGVTMGGGIVGVIVIPEALKGAVDVLLLADAGDVTGAGAQAFKALGKEAARMSAAALRTLVANEARAACERELRATIQRLSRTPRWQALTAEERRRAARIAWYELQRRFFRGFGKVAKDAERTATKALRREVGVRRALAQESVDTARVGAEAAEVEPVAGRLPRNHEFAGKEFPRERLPAKYRDKGLRFKSTGYPDFEPYAATLPNGKKTVRIELTGSMDADEALANKAAGLEERPEGFIWHHVEDEGTMMLVPASLHEAVPHTGGRATFKHRTGISYDN